jgi:hypothetical protein
MEGALLNRGAFYITWSKGKSSVQGQGQCCNQEPKAGNPHELTAVGTSVELKRELRIT